jgi:hypothetical protein
MTEYPLWPRFGTDTRVEVANKVRTFRSEQRLHIGIVEGEHRGEWGPL